MRPCSRFPRRPAVRTLLLVVLLLGGADVAAASDPVWPLFVVPDASVIPDVSADTARDRPTRRTLEAAPAASPLVLDGRLDESAWGAAEVAEEFVQQAPRPGAAATERTEARVVFTDDALWIGMRLHDTESAGIAATLGRRDYTGFSDWAQVLIDSYADGRTAYRFAVNPAGVKKDVFHYDDGKEDPGWDAVWDAAVRTDPAGWTAEMRIPLSQLRFDASAREWGINFLRDVARKGERSYWSPILPGTVGFVSQFGRLRNLKAIEPVRRFEVVPYSMGRLTRAPGSADDPFHRSNRWLGTAGADIRAGISSGLTLTATINPDFGQVEADPSEVNLSGFETFLQERRPFFVEASDVFRFGPEVRAPVRYNWFGNDQLFYSRRIGRSPQGDVPADAEYSDPPTETTILGAAKLSGRTAGGWSVGLLHAVTSEEAAPFARADGVHTRQIVEPLTHYSVARLIRNGRDGRSAVGAIATAAVRDASDASALGLRSRALAGGLDARHRFTSGYELSGLVMGSRVDGSASAVAELQRGAGHYFQRPDAPHLDFDPQRRSLAGWAANAGIEKSSGNLRWALYGLAISPGFETNDVGFGRSSDWALYTGRLRYSSYEPGRVFRSWTLWLNQRQGWSFGGERQAFSTGVGLEAQFLNFWSLDVGVNHERSALAPSELRGGPALRMQPATNGWVSIESDTRRAVSASLFGWQFRDHDTDGRVTTVMPELTLRPSSRIDASIGGRFQWGRTPAQYVGQPSDGTAPQYVFAAWDRRMASLQLRLAYTFTPDLSLQWYAQPFLSAGAFSRFSRVVDPQARDFGARFAPFAGDQLTHDPGSGRYLVDPDRDGVTDFAFADPAFNVRELRSTAVLRWEYRPGSTLFVVWSQTRDGAEPSGDFRWRRDVRELFGLKPTNVMIVKLSYWLGR